MKTAFVIATVMSAIYFVNMASFLLTQCVSPSCLFEVPLVMYGAGGEKEEWDYFWSYSASGAQKSFMLLHSYGWIAVVGAFALALCVRFGIFDAWRRWIADKDARAKAKEDAFYEEFVKQARKRK